MTYISKMAYISQSDNSYESSKIRFHNDMNTHIYKGGTLVTC